MRFTAKGAWIRFDQLDLSGINQLELALNPGNTKGKLEIRLGSPDGQVIGGTKVLTKEDRPANLDGQFFPVKVQLQTTSDFQDLYLVFVPDGDVSIWNTFNLNTIRFIR